jgi:hypothetical protein
MVRYWPLGGALRAGPLRIAAGAHPRRGFAAMPRQRIAPPAYPDGRDAGRDRAAKNRAPVPSDADCVTRLARGVSSANALGAADAIRPGADFLVVCAQACRSREPVRAVHQFIKDSERALRVRPRVPLETLPRRIT